MRADDCAGGRRLGERPLRFPWLPAAQGKGALRELLLEYADRRETLIAYESPYRLNASLAAIADVLGDGRRVCVAREISKMFERFYRGAARDLRDYFAADHPRGEVTLVVAGADPKADPMVGGARESGFARAAGRGRIPVSRCQLKSPSALAGRRMRSIAWGFKKPWARRLGHSPSLRSRDTSTSMASSARRSSQRLPLIGAYGARRSLPDAPRDKRAKKRAWRRSCPGSLPRSRAGRSWIPRVTAVPGARLPVAQQPDEWRRQRLAPEVARR